MEPRGRGSLPAGCHPRGARSGLTHVGEGGLFLRPFQGVLAGGRIALIAAQPLLPVQALPWEFLESVQPSPPLPRGP